MSQYAVIFNEKNNTITLKNEKADGEFKNQISHIRADKLGELSEATVHPQPYEHLKNLMSNRGIDFKLVTVKNETDNERLDSLEQEGQEVSDHDKTVQVVTGAEDGNAGQIEMRAPSEA